ncbi:MAG: DUF192 domain-containing protein [Nitrospira sp.]|nr:DUF192 domain-containing protein [Nitrospira sp.]
MAESPNSLKTPSKTPLKRSRIYVLIALALLLVVGSWIMTNQKDSETIIVTFPSGKQLETEVADTPEKLLFGLAFREGLPPDSGMLYIFETSDLHRVRTKAFKFPVDMIWADESRRVVYLVEGAEPCPQDPCPLYGPPPEKIRYLIQTLAGFVEQEGIVPGMELKFTLRL